jgi:hypothetical protein
VSSRLQAGRVRSATAEGAPPVSPFGTHLPTSPISSVVLGARLIRYSGTVVRHDRCTAPPWRPTALLNPAATAAPLRRQHGGGAGQEAARGGRAAHQPVSQAHQFREDGVATEPRGSRGTLHEDHKFSPPSWTDPQLAPHHAAEPHRAAQLLACPATHASGLPRGNQMGHSGGRPPVPAKKGVTFKKRWLPCTVIKSTLPLPCRLPLGVIFFIKPRCQILFLLSPGGPQYFKYVSPACYRRHALPPRSTVVSGRPWCGKPIKLRNPWAKNTIFLADRGHSEGPSFLKSQPNRAARTALDSPS